MLRTTRSYGGMVTAPHHLASQAGLEVLCDGGNALEAMVAAAAAIAVVYPHMNGLGGDGFWLVARRGEVPVAIHASGRSAELATRSFYAGQEAIPSRGPKAALTVAGAVSGWQAAYDLSRERFGGTLPRARLLQDAIRHAREGVAVTRSMTRNSCEKLAELSNVPGFAETWLEDGQPLGVGQRLRQPRIAATLERLAEAGFDDFYRGDLARSIATDLETAGSPLRLPDLEHHRADRVAPLSVDVAGHRVHNLPPPTQGLASLILLALYGSMPAEHADGFDFVHRIVECTKAAFRVRDAYVTDPDYMAEAPESFLTQEALARLASQVSHDRAAPWPHPGRPGDTVWLGAIDSEGLAVSYIQSLYWEFGSGLVLPGSGITWQNRGTSFSLDEGALNRLEPRRLPFHTIQPALAELSDGRMMVYGTMGGEGQPQTQAVVFARHVLHGMPLQQAVTAPRWLLGRTWGAATTNLKVEAGLGLADELHAAGHDVEVVEDYAEMMGHAGAIVRHQDGLLEGASDPRSNGAVAAR